MKVNKYIALGAIFLAVLVSFSVMSEEANKRGRNYRPYSLIHEFDVTIDDKGTPVSDNLGGKFIATEGVCIYCHRTTSRIQGNDFICVGCAEELQNENYYCPKNPS